MVSDNPFRHALLVRGREELLDGQPCFCDQTAQRAPCNFRMIGYRKSSRR